jgi:hypothetical protein
MSVTPAERSRWESPPGRGEGCRSADEGHCTYGSTRVQGKWFPRRPAVLIIDCMTDTRTPSDRRVLALGLAVAVAAYAVLYRFADYSTTAVLPWPFAALAVYGGARLRPWQALALVFLVMAGTDLYFFRAEHRGVSWPTYLSFALTVLLGWASRPLYRRDWPTAVAGATAAGVVGYALFFLVTNAVAWAGNAESGYKPHTFETLLLAYREGLEFIRKRPGEWFGAPALAGLVFAAHAVLARAYFPAERFGAEPAR